MPPRQERPPYREVEPPDYGRAYDYLRKSFEKELQHAQDTGAHFDAETVMLREVFDRMNGDDNLTTEGWERLRKDFYEPNPARDAASAKKGTAKEPKAEAPATPPVPEVAPTPEAGPTPAQEAPTGPAPKKKSVRAERREQERAKAEAAAKASLETANAREQAPQEKPATAREQAPESKEATGPKPHEYVVKKSRDGWSVMKRGNERSLDRTFRTNVRLSDAIVAHLEREPAFAEEVAERANELRKEWRFRRDLTVDIPELEGIEQGTPEEVDARFEEFLKEPSALNVLASYKDRNRYKTDKIPVTEVFTDKAAADIFGKMPRRHPDDPAAQEEWQKWGKGVFRDGVIDFIVTEVIARRYDEAFGGTAKEHPIIEDAKVPVPTPEQENAPVPTATPERAGVRESLLLPADASKDDVDDLAVRWARENPDDANHPRVKNPRSKKSEVPEAPPKEKTLEEILSPWSQGLKPTKAPEAPPTPAPEPPPLPKKKKPVLETQPEPKPESEEAVEVTDAEVTEVVPQPKKPETKEAPAKKEAKEAREARIAEARSAVTITLEKVARAIPELGEHLAAPGLREHMTGWYTDLFTREHVSDADRAGFGLVYDAKTRKVVVKMKTFRNAIKAFRKLREETGA